MTEQAQQYPVLNCKKVSKAKTTSLKLYDRDQSSSDSISKTDKILHEVETKQHDSKTISKTQNFSYLDHSKSGLGKGKSFQNILQQTKRILDMQKNIEREQKKKQESKKVQKAKKKSEKLRKQGKKQKKKVEKQKAEDDDIMLTEIDIQRFSTESRSIKRLIEKIDWLKNLGEKCNIISPLLNWIESEAQENNTNQKKSSIIKGALIEKNEKMMIKVSELELEIELMKKNLDQNVDQKDILSLFEIGQFAKWQISEKSQHGFSKLLNSYDFLQKYIDRDNLQDYAQDLQNQLLHMEMTEFQKFNQDESLHQE